MKPELHFSGQRENDIRSQRPVGEYQCGTGTGGNRSGIAQFIRISEDACGKTKVYKIRELISCTTFRGRNYTDTES